MTLEIERRFLLKNDKWKKFITKKTFIEQGYLSDNLDDWITRIRFNGQNYKIALKKHLRNFTNFEFEYIIPRKDGKQIISSLKKTIKKERFFLKFENQNWIVDCFRGENFPLEIAEVELSKEEENLNLPNFISTEITGIKNFSNFSLTNYPFSNWVENDLKAIKKN